MSKETELEGINKHYDEDEETQHDKTDTDLTAGEYEPP